MGNGGTSPDFDAIVDRQGALEQERPFRSYREITKRSLMDVLDFDEQWADAIGDGVGEWPAYADAARGVKRMMALAPCVAMTNSDRAHGVQAQRGLGFLLSAWICAEDVRCYKPDPAFWGEVSRRLGVEPGRGRGSTIAATSSTSPITAAMIELGQLPRRDRRVRDKDVID